MAIGLFGLVGLTALAQAQGKLAEPKLKAAFVLNFVRYITWPEKVFASREAPIVVCLVGRDDGSVDWSSIDGRTAQDRPLKLRHEVDLESDQKCHAVFIGEAEARRIPATLRRLQRLPVLTLSDAEGFIDSGGAIGIVRGEQRLQFEVNRSALDNAQLKGSAQLLKLARAVLAPGS